MKSKYHRTIAIEPVEILADKSGKAFYFANDILKEFLNKEYTIILWSYKGKEFCKKLLNNSNIKNIKIWKKDINKSNKVFLCLDHDKDFAQKFRTYNILHFNNTNNRSLRKIKSIVQKHHTFVELIEENINGKTK